MPAETAAICLVVGGYMGFLAGEIFEGYGLGTLANIAAGMMGAVVAGLVLPNAGIWASPGATALAAAFGASILLLILGLMRRNGE